MVTTLVMKTFLRRIPAAVALLSALCAATIAFAAPPTAVAITAPANGANLGALSSPANTVTITATATSSGAPAFITQVDFRVNGVSIGVATAAPYSMVWTPTAAGSYTLTAIATDSSAASNNSLTSAPVTVSISAVRVANVVSPAANSAVAQNSEIFVRGTASMTDGVVSQVEYLLGGTSLGTVTTSPYNLAATITTAPGSYNLVARATASDGVTTWESSATHPINVVAAVVAGPTVAIVSPTATDVVAVGASVTVTASASDADGFIPNTAPGGVTFYADGEPIGTDLSAPYSVSWTPTVAKTVSLRALATDDKTNTRLSAAVSVTVLASAPSVSITSPANNSNGTVGTAVNVNATATAGTGTTITSVQFLENGVAITAADTTAPYSVSWTPATAGTSALTARVTDSNGVSVTSSTINVNVSSAPGTLAATLTAPVNGATIPLGTTTTLTATASAAGTATVSRVDFLVGAAVVGTSLSAPYSANWTPTTSGVFSLTARVTDSTGATANSPISNVTVTGPTVSLTSPTAGSTVAVGIATSLVASTTTVAPATATRVDFFNGTTLLGSAFSAPFTFSWTPSATGAASLTARVTDSSGGVAASSSVAVTVAASAPTVSVTAPANGAIIPLGTTATLTATASTPGGATVNRVDFLAGTTVVGTALTAPYSVTWTPTVAAVVPITARVTDSTGASATSPIVNVTVQAPTVALTAPTNGAAVAGGSTFTLTATAAAVGAATVAKVDFFAGTTLLGTDSTAPYSFDWVAAGNVVSLTARVTDSNGAVAASTPVSVTVTSTAPTVSLTSPTPGTVVTTGTAVTIAATATPSAGATVTQVQFLAGSTILDTDTTFPYGTTWTQTAAGNISLTARVTDSNGNSATSSVATVTVNAVTTGPLSVALSLSGSLTIPVGSTRSLTATPTPNTNIDRVELLYDGSIVASDNTSPYNFLFTAPDIPGLHSLRARVIDTSGNTAESAIIAITIGGGGGASPLVAINTPLSNAFLAAGVNTPITGSVSDSDGTITSVQVFVNGTSIGNATLAGASWTINWNPSGTGVASIIAVATDNTGNSIASPAVGVNLADAASPIITLAVSPRTAATAASTTLPSGAVRNFVADVIPASGRAVVRVEFFVDGTKVGEDTSVPYTFRYVAPLLNEGEQSRTYALSARATDNAGAARDVQLPLLVVAPIGQPPTVNLLTPTNGASVFPNSAVSLAATAVANGGTIASVQFYVNGSPVGINGGNAIAAAPYTSSFTPTVPGNYTIDAIATDDRGNTKISNSVTITAAFATPTVVFTSPNPNATARATPNVPLTLAATATVQSGTGAAILLVEFLLDDVQIGADTTAPFTFSWIPNATQLGQHQLRARVTDTNSQVTVSNPITVNVANVIGSPPTVSVSASPIPAVFGLQTVSTVNFMATAVATGAGSTLANVEIFLNDISIGLATREQNTNFYRVAYDLNRFDFTSLTPLINENTGAVTYPVRLYAIARDSNNNQTVSSTTNLVINPATSAPPSIQLFAATPTNITAGTQFFMQANFNDLDGVVTTIQLFANGTAVATFANPQQGQFLTYNANNAGRFNLYAVATDDTGNTMVSSPSIVINVTAVNAPVTTLTRPTDNSTQATVGSPVFLEGTARNTSTTQVPTLQFVATAGGGSRQLINGIRVGTTTTYRAIWTPVNPDTYTVTTQASVGQVQGTSTASRRVVVTEVLGLAPSVTLTRATGVSGVPTTATTASTADFSATATDPDGSIVEVEFFLTRNSVGQARKDPQGNTWRVTASFAGLLPGATEVVALARDSSGNISASPTSNINVTAASSIAPSIAITPSTLNPAFNRAVQLRSNARDSDGNVNSVQYFANATSIGTQSGGNAANNLFLQSWTPTVSGTYYIWAVATDNTGITRVSDTLEMNVRRNNPVLENAAFILQTYQDIANTTNINPLVFDQLDEQLASGELTRADIIVSDLTANGGVALTELAGFQAPVNLLALYYVLMGQWPTPANYTTFLATARTNLPNAVGNILNANEYFAKYGFVPTNTLLNNPNGVLPAQVFLDRLWANAGSRPSTNRDTDLVRFMSNNVATVGSATVQGIGRGYGPAGLNTAIAEFVTHTNSNNTALFARARAAALFYQLTRPPVTVTVDEITARIDALLKLPNNTAIADAVLKDVLYGYRYVTITKHPQSLVVAPRSGVIMSVEAQGAPPLVYQWLLNGAPIPGATNTTLSFANADTSRVGTYTVAITSNAATATSDRATVTLSNLPTKLGNISTRGVTSGGANVLIGGFVVAGNNQQQTRQMLIRVIGPTLGAAPFNVPGVLANPRLEVYTGNNPNPVLTNDDWGTQAGGNTQVNAIRQASLRVAAFDLANNSVDAVVLATLPPGQYTVQAKGPANNPNASGVVLIEVYDVTPNLGAAGRAVNVSTRGSVGTGTNVLIAGFVVNGTVSRRVLIRGAGPTLASLGVPGVLTDPQLTLVDQATGRTLATNDNWASGEDAAIIAAAARSAGAFPLANGSRDAAILVMLPPGAYTAQLSGVGGGTGVGIVEVYDVDP